MHFGPETFLLRVSDDAMAPTFRAGDFAYVDPDVPMESGHFVVCQDKAGLTVRQYNTVEGTRMLRTLNPESVDVVVNVDNETMIRGVVVFWGRRV